MYNLSEVCPKGFIPADVLALKYVADNKEQIRKHLKEHPEVTKALSDVLTMGIKAVMSERATSAEEANADTEIFLSEIEPCE